MKARFSTLLRKSESSFSDAKRQFQGEAQKGGRDYLIAPVWDLARIAVRQSDAIMLLRTTQLLVTGWCSDPDANF